MAASRASESEIARVQELADRLESGPATRAAGSTTSRPTWRRSRRTRSCTPPSSEPPTTDASTPSTTGCRTHVLVARAVFPRLYRGEPHRRGSTGGSSRPSPPTTARPPSEAMAAHLRQALADTLRHVEQQAVEPTAASTTRRDHVTRPADVRVSPGLVASAAGHRGDRCARAGRFRASGRRRPGAGRSVPVAATGSAGRAAGRSGQPAGRPCRARDARARGPPRSSRLAASPTPPRTPCSSSRRRSCRW